MWVPLFKAILMKALLNVDVVFGNVTEVATFAGTGSPTAGSAILSPAPPCWAPVHDEWISGESRECQNSLAGESAILSQAPLAGFQRLFERQ